MQQSSLVRRCAASPIICLFVWTACALASAAAENSPPTAEQTMPDPDAVIRRILGVDGMGKNVCLIGSHHVVNAADLPGRLVAISPDQQVPSDLLRYSFRKPGAKAVTQVNPPTTPIQITRLESSQVRGGTLAGWFGATLAKDDMAEVRTVPLPASSISVDDLDEQAIVERFSAVPAEVRKGLGIITDVIPYEVVAAVCKKTTAKVESGVWYIHLGKDTFYKLSDELRKYYLVAVYTPLVFYDDIGVIPGTSSAATLPDKRLPDISLLSREDVLKIWLEKNPAAAEAASFSKERQVGWAGEAAVGEPSAGAVTEFEVKTAPRSGGASPGFATSSP